MTGDVLAASALALAERFAAGATLWCYSAEAPHHAAHVAVEFVHPVSVGARALPAVAVRSVDELAAVREVDVVLVIGAADVGVIEGAALIRVEGPVDNAAVVRTYHVLWELTQIALTSAASSDDFLYPFIDGEADRDDASLAAALAESAHAKKAQSEALGDETLRALDDDLTATASAIAARVAAGGRLITFGNGGSATDASGTAACFRKAGIAARCLAENPAVLSALANDIGFEAVFARQLDGALGPHDVAFGFSTSGESANVLRALSFAHKQGALTIGTAGYDGGAMAGTGLDHCLVVRSDSVHRVQETQTAIVFELCRRVRATLGG